MANEIVTTTSLIINKDGGTITLSKTVQETLVGTGKFSTVQLIGTSTELIVFPADLITEGIKRIFLLNLGIPGGPIDVTNYIQVGLNTPVTQIFARLIPGGQALSVPTDNAVTVDPTWYAKSNGAACNLMIGASGT